MLCAVFSLELWFLFNCNSPGEIKRWHLNYYQHHTLVEISFLESLEGSEWDQKVPLRIWVKPAIRGLHRQTSQFYSGSEKWEARLWQAAEEARLHGWLLKRWLSSQHINPATFTDVVFPLCYKTSGHQRGNWCFEVLAGIFNWLKFNRTMFIILLKVISTIFIHLYSMGLESLIDIVCFW